MKQLVLLIGIVCLALTGIAQNDSTKKTGNPADTIHVGNMTIIKSGDSYHHEDDFFMGHRHGDYHPSNISTNWIIVDLGFANFNDNTNYSSSEAQAFAKGSTKDWFDLNNGKSVDVNIWLFMQRLNMIQHVVNLKYGLGIELNNYRYTRNIRYQSEPTTHVIMDTIQYSKNKLAADYVTVPLMLNFNFTPHRRDGFGISVGVSAGYLYNSRQKVISGQYGKQKIHNSYDLNPWKLSWIAEVQLGPIKLYGSYATQSMFSTGLDQIPYTFGLRLSNW